MGCDIHVYVEYRSKKEGGQWDSFGGRINPGRNYLLFGIMSNGVRSDPTFSFEVKGMPDDMAYSAKDDSLIFISDTPGDNYVTLEKARQWEKYGHKIINNNAGEPTWVEHPDWHSHSWLTTDEFEKAMSFYNKEANPKRVEPEYEALLSTMKRFEELGYNSRIVFWFDN